MRRALPLYFLLSVLLTSFAGYVWLTYHPRSAALERATRWPIVGGAAQALQEYVQERYLQDSPPRESRQPEGQAREQKGPGEPSTSVRGNLTDTGFDSQDNPAPQPWTPQRTAEGLVLHQWLPTGSKLFAHPDVDAEWVATLDRAQPLALLEDHDEWLRLLYRGQPVWVLAPGDPPLGRAPSPVLPVPGRAPSAEHLQRARALLGSEDVRRIGPYPLHTDVEDVELLGLLDHVGLQLPQRYQERYGLAPLFPAAESAVLFTRAQDYRVYLSTLPDLAHLDPNGHVGDGLLVVAVGHQKHRQVAATVIHEMTHLINRRAIGPALPSWLDEGLAEDLSYGHIDEHATFHAAQLPPAPALRPGTTVRFEGVQAAIRLLQQRRAQGRAPSIQELTQTLDFKDLDSDASLLAYATSGLFVRFLLDEGLLLDERLLDGREQKWSDDFRAFLAAVASGAPPTGDALREQLGVSWNELEKAFDSWLASL